MRSCGPLADAGRVAPVASYRVLVVAGLVEIKDPISAKRDARELFFVASKDARLARGHHQALILIELASAAHLEVNTWTVNDEAEMRRLLPLGLGAMITDEVTKLARVMKTTRD